VVEVGATTLLLPVALIGAAHEYVEPVDGLAASVTASPLQITPSLLAVPEVSVNEIVGVGRGLTVTEADAVAEHAIVGLVTVTV
jgi:hypothetical protein